MTNNTKYSPMLSVEHERAAYEEWQWRRDWPIDALAGALRAEYFKRKFLETEKYESDRFNYGLSVWLARATLPVKSAPVAHTMRSVMDAAQQARGFPVLTSNQCHALAEALNGVKP